MLVQAGLCQTCSETTGGSINDDNRPDMAMAVNWDVKQQLCFKRYFLFIFINSSLFIFMSMYVYMYFYVLYTTTCYLCRLEAMCIA